MKTSLSKVLTRYYPLAGRVANNNYVDCNDEGALFLEAQVSCQLSQVIQNPCSAELKRLLPDHVTDECLAVQVNFFTCGSFAIGVSISHKIGDGSSLITFVKNWAAVARGDGKALCTEFVGAKLFPPNDIEGFDWDKILLGDVVLKRFVFDGSVITKLREKYANGLSSKHHIYPTRVEALSSFIWSRFQSSTDTKIGPEKPLVWLHAVNLRKRMNPRLPDDSFGNLFRVGCIVSSEPTAEEDCVKKFRDMISNIDVDFMKKIQDNWNVDILDQGKVFTFNNTSLCRYPVYEVDFGWGRPEWVAWGGLPYKNLVVLMDNKSGDGIEAWMHLTEEDMAKFEADPELLHCLSSI